MMPYDFKFSNRSGEQEVSDNNVKGLKWKLNQMFDLAQKYAI